MDFTFKIAVLMRCLLYLLVIASINSVAQSLFNKSGEITISTGTIVTVGDSLINNGNLANNGDLRISGAWINNGTYDAGNGQITFNSTRTQIINHNDQSFRKLVINGGGEKKFLANITVESELNLQNGILVSDKGAKIILQEGAKITGASDQSYVVGPVEHQGKGDWEFPIGSGTVYLPVVISDVSDSKTIAILSLHEINNETLKGDVDFAKLSDQRYWELNVTAGSLDGSRITLPLDNESFSDNTERWVVASAAAITDPFASLGQSDAQGNASSGKVTSEKSAMTSFFTTGEIVDDKIIVVYNGVSPNNDGSNDFLKIHNITLYPNNKVSIFNRWGDKVFEASGYDNDKVFFKGENNLSGASKLLNGTYFYTIEPGDGSEKITGYLDLRY